MLPWAFCAYFDMALKLQFRNRQKDILPPLDTPRRFSAIDCIHAVALVVMA